jgi:biopolymer transport protein ExbD
MGVNFGAGGGRRSVDCELNLVPLVDLMTCMTAFLLITAVWSNVTTLDVEPEGRKLTAEGLPKPPPPKVSVLVEGERVWVGDNRNTEGRWIARGELGELEATLVSMRGIDQPSVEVAGSSTDSDPVALQDLIDVMQTAREAGYRRVGLSDASGLTTIPAS